MSVNILRNSSVLRLAFGTRMSNLVTRSGRFYLFRPTTRLLNEKKETVLVNEKTGLENVASNQQSFTTGSFFVVAAPLFCILSLLAYKLFLGERDDSQSHLHPRLLINPASSPSKDAE